VDVLLRTRLPSRQLAIRYARYAVYACESTFDRPALLFAPQIDRLSNGVVVGRNIRILQEEGHVMHSMNGRVSVKRECVILRQSTRLK